MTTPDKLTIEELEEIINDGHSTNKDSEHE